MLLSIQIMEEESRLKEDRKKDSDKIIKSKYPKRVVVAGPGTGKSFLFKKIIEEEVKNGSTNFLVITFMGKLCDELADELAGLSKVFTLHGFAREFLFSQLSNKDEWVYQTNIKDIIFEDLKINSIDNCKIEDDSYHERTKYYKAVGHDDVIFYANKILKKKDKVPKYDLILIDEFQDFNESEAQLIDLLAEKNRIIIVGDDDQALYDFKGSFSKFICDKYDEKNQDFESHCLKYCSRCTEVIISAFHRIVDFYKDKGRLKDRISNKEYVCFYPEKNNDNKNNQKIILIENIPIGSIHKKIKSELETLLKNQKIKSVLILGEATSLSSSLKEIAQRLIELGFRNVESSLNNDVFGFEKDIFDAYKIFNKNNNLAWRIILNSLKDSIGESYSEIIKKSFVKDFKFVDELPKDVIKKHNKNAKTFSNIVSKTKCGRDLIADSSISDLSKDLVDIKKEERELVIDQIIKETKHLNRPLANLSISVCSILKSKGLSADVVFLVGFDNGKLPKDTDAKDGEIYQMLVALTRARKRIYLLNTIGSSVSEFAKAIGDDLVEKNKFETKKRSEGQS